MLFESQTYLNPTYGPGLYTWQVGHQGVSYGAARTTGVLQVMQQLVNCPIKSGPALSASDSAFPDRNRAVCASIAHRLSASRTDNIPAFVCILHNRIRVFPQPTLSVRRILFLRDNTIRNYRKYVVPFCTHPTTLRSLSDSLSRTTAPFAG